MIKGNEAANGERRETAGELWRLKLAANKEALKSALAIRRPRVRTANARTGDRYRMSVVPATRQRRACPLSPDGGRSPISTLHRASLSSAASSATRR